MRANHGQPVLGQLWSVLGLGIGPVRLTPGNTVRFRLPDRVSQSRKFDFR